MFLFINNLTDHLFQVHIPLVRSRRAIIPRKLLKFIVCPFKKAGTRLRKRLSPIPIPKTPRRPSRPPGTPGQPRPEVEPDPEPVRPPLPYPNTPRRKTPPLRKPQKPNRPFFGRARI